MAKPRKIMDKETHSLRLMLKAEGLYPMHDGWDIYVTDTVRGRCNYNSKNMTVPLWAFKVSPDKGASKHLNDRGYTLYYACHEIAHGVAGVKAAHGPAFMDVFMAICPKHLQHFELGYKPRNAAAAGIRSK